MTRLPSALRPLFPWLKTGVLRATQAVSPLTRRLPGATPPRHVARSAADYARAHPGGGVEVVEVVAALDLHRPLPAGLPADHPQFAGTSSRAHCAQRRRHRPARPRARALRGSDDGGRHAPLRPLAVLRRGHAVAASRLPALPSACGDGGPRFGGRPHHAGERQLLPLRARRAAAARAVATGRRGARRLPREQVHPVPARPARPPRPHGRPLSGRREVPARPGRRARRAVAARRRSAHPSLDRPLAPRSHSCPTTSARPIAVST